MVDESDDSSYGPEALNSAAKRVASSWIIISRAKNVCKTFVDIRGGFGSRQFAFVAPFADIRCVITYDLGKIC